MDINWEENQGGTWAQIDFYNDDGKRVGTQEVVRPTKKTEPEWNSQTVYSEPKRKTVADEQEGEKWTHRTSLGKCRVLIDTPDEHGYVVIEGDGDGYSLVPPRTLKPIKPTLTKAQAWDYAVASGLYAEDIERNYDITD